MLVPVPRRRAPPRSRLEHCPGRGRGGEPGGSDGASLALAAFAPMSTSGGRACSARTAATSIAALATLALLLESGAAAQQKGLAHKVLGTLGLQAGSQGSTGIYVVDQVVTYEARDLVDRNGNSLPVGLNATALGNSIGAAATFRIAPLATYVTGAVSVPLAWATVSTENPSASLDRFGLGDVYVQPLQLGWRTGRADVVIGYALYFPTGRFEPGGKGGVGNGYWTQEPSLGGTLFFDDQRAWNVSALASVDINGRMRDVDVTRGATLQVQGGVGTTPVPLLEVGVVASALWQLTDDGGTALPASLRGARDRNYAAGAEVNVKIPPIRMGCTIRYEHDFLTQSRPLGQVVFIGLTGLVWDPQARGAPPAP